MSVFGCRVGLQCPDLAPRPPSIIRLGGAACVCRLAHALAPIDRHHRVPGCKHQPAFTSLNSGASLSCCSVIVVRKPLSENANAAPALISAGRRFPLEPAHSSSRWFVSVAPAGDYQAAGGGRRSHAPGPSGGPTSHSNNSDNSSLIGVGCFPCSRQVAGRGRREG
jgi:hypothetical protein